MQVLCGLALGSVHALSFAPWPAWWLQLISLSTLIFLWLRRVPGDHKLDGLLLPFSFGIGWFGLGISWLYISMHRYGGMPAPIAATAVLLLSIVLTLFTSAAYGVAKYVDRDRRDGMPARTSGAADDIVAAVSFGALWLLAEWGRGWLFTGFPWLASGYAHIDGPLVGYAPLLGVYAVSGLAATIAYLIATSALAWFKRARFNRNESTQTARAALTANLLLVAALLIGGMLAKRIDWSQAHGQPLNVRLLQANVPQQMKFVPGAAARSMQQYSKMATAPSSLGALDLIVMPETAWTIPWQATPPAIVEQLFSTSGNTPSPAIAIGMPLAVDTALGTIANSVLMLRGDKLRDLSARYDKQHLVPFGEFVPFGFQWFVDLMNIPLGSFARGSATQAPLVVAEQRVAFNICYEDVFGEELALSVRRDGGNASVLVNISNIGWFGDSLALPQHLQIARMRAIELARPMLRATNTGVTASIDARGVVRAALPNFSIGVLEDQVVGMVGDTPFARWTHMPSLLFSLSLLVVLLLKRRYNA